VEAFDYYVKIHVADRFFLLRETMKKMEERLPENSFARIHKSFIINLAHAKAMHRQENNEYEIELADGTHLKVSRNFKAHLLERLGA
jgi:two-component system, LytTR family, response regulator